MSPARKKPVSLRADAADLSKLRLIAERLDARESDIIRLAIRNLLVRFSALTDPAVRGRALVPLFLEAGAELTQGLKLDAEQLNYILNDGASPEDLVPLEHVHMIATLGAGEISGSTRGNGDGSTASERRTSPTRRFLCREYLFQDGADTAKPAK